MRRLRVLTWHVHGSYLESLGHVGHDIIVPWTEGRPEGYGGRPAPVRWPDTIREVPAAVVRDLDVDVVVFQSARNWLVDQHEVLSDTQRRGPRVFIEHDPPRGHPTDTRHPVDDPDVLLVHVTAFNALMWDSGRTPVRVIDHGVFVPEDLEYRGDLERGIVVVNDLARRGRRLGADLVEQFRREVPLDLAGMGSEDLGGIGNVPSEHLPAVMARYRFYAHPVRYTSLGMALCEAMLVGLPVVGLATTELVTVIRDGESGFIGTDPDHLVAGMRTLLADPRLAAQMGRRAREVARERFHIRRFARDWDAVLREAAGVAAAAPHRPLAAAAASTRAGA